MHEIDRLSFLQRVPEERGGSDGDGQHAHSARDEMLEVVRDLLVEILGATEALETLLQNRGPAPGAGQH